MTISGATNRINDRFYDVAGNMTTGPPATPNAWDALGMMGTHSDPLQTETYLYHASDERIRGGQPDGAAVALDPARGRREGARSAGVHARPLSGAPAPDREIWIPIEWLIASWSCTD